MAKLLFDHIVVLMLENRSFDHLFGYLGVGEGLDPAKPATNYLDPAKPSPSTAFKSQRGGDYTAAGQGPSHSLKQVNEQLYGVTKPTPAALKKTPPLNGFVSSFEVSLQYDLKRKPTPTELQQVMNVFDPEQLPVLSTLAKSFVLCDRWFADVPGPTMPNRAFVHAATSQGYTYNANWKPHFTCKTLYDRINATPGVTWRIYKHDQDDVLELYPNLESGTTNHVPFTEYLSDVAGDTLATYSFIVPAFLGKTQQVNSMHAPADVRPGEKLVADVYGALRQHPDVWKKTLLIVVFDEHGGYYDHVPPPPAVAPDGIKGRMDQPFLVPFDFTRLGLRVPAILISPWFPAAVDSTVYSHATIPGSVIDAFGLKGGYLTKRDKNAAKLTQKYLVDDGKRTWRTVTPDVVVPAQPPALDAMQRDLLHGAALADPDPDKQNVARVEDIQDPEQAQQFVRTQFAKRLEHKLAARGKNAINTASAYNEPPTTMVSPARIAELRRPAKPPGPRP